MGSDEQTILAASARHAGILRRSDAGIGRAV